MESLNLLLQVVYAHHLIYDLFFVIHLGFKSFLAVLYEVSEASNQVL